jgi:NADP-dependent 3-hydroxy acid dehydrogenase YdfG
MSKPMDKRVALVTGASSGIGRAIAVRLLRQGLRVAACARRLDRLEKLREAAPGGDYLPIQCDVRDEQQIAAMFERIRETWGGIDALVNNAGLGHHAPLASGQSQHWREMLEVNVLALSICTREAVTDMRKRGDDGHVIHISSMASHRVPRGSGMYSATKFAVRALTEGLRQELRELDSGIRVTAISPGYVETEFAARYHDSEEAARKTYGGFKCLEADDVARAVDFALSQPAHVQLHDILMRPTQQAS